MHTAGPMRANRAITRQEAHYTRHVFLSAADLQHTHCQLGRFLMCGCNQGALGFSIGRIGERWRHHWDQPLSLPKRFPNRRAIHLGRDWHFCLPSDLVWGLFTKAASVGMKCWEPKPNSQRIGAKALSVWMGGIPDRHLRPITCDLLLTNTRLERLMRQSSEHRLEMPIGGFL
jgi:hypothetical protein